MRWQESEHCASQASSISKQKLPEALNKRTCLSNVLKGMGKKSRWWRLLSAVRGQVGIKTALKITQASSLSSQNPALQA